MDQIGDVGDYIFNDAPGPAPSQIFTDFPEYNCTVLEDFTVSSLQLRITQVSVLFRAQGGFIGFQDVQGYYLNFFNDVNLAASGLAGDAGSTVVPVGSGASVTQVIDAEGDHEYGLVSLNVDIPLPSAGNYWVGVSPVSASSTTGQFFLQLSTCGHARQCECQIGQSRSGFWRGRALIPGCGLRLFGHRRSRARCFRVMDSRRLWLAFPATTRPLTESTGEIPASFTILRVFPLPCCPPNRP